MSIRTSTPRKSCKIKFAVSGLALAAAAAGAVSVWPASAAAQQSASASQAAPAALSVARDLAPQVVTSNGAAVLDSVSARTTTKPAPRGHKPVRHVRKHRRKAVRLTPKQIARRMLRTFHWSKWEFQWLNLLWSRESSWNVHASNPYSGAYGIPQAVPGAKMASAGPDWERNARTQIRWGMDYIKGRYGSPYGAWQHELATGWY